MKGCSVSTLVVGRDGWRGRGSPDFDIVREEPAVDGLGCVSHEHSSFECGLHNTQYIHAYIHNITRNAHAHVMPRAGHGRCYSSPPLPYGHSITARALDAEF